MKIFLIDETTAKSFAAMYSNKIVDVLKFPYMTLGAFDEEGDKEPAGLLVARIDKDTVYVDWLYVREKYRRTGIATKLMSKLLVTVAATNEVKFIFVSASEDNVGLIEFYRYMGVTIDFTGAEAVLESKVRDIKPAEYSEKEICDKHLVQLSELTDRSFNELYDRMRQSDNAACTLELPIRREDYIPECVAYYDGGIQAIVLAKKAEDAIDITFAYSEQSKIKELGIVAKVVHRAIKENYDPETIVRVGIMRKESEPLAKHFAPTAKRNAIGWTIEAIDLLSI